MELNQIRYAYCVAKYRNFSKAADQLFVTQPTLSQQIRKLEEELGFPLFVRSTRTVQLTPEGEIFCEKAGSLLYAFNSFTREMETLRKDQEISLTVGLLPTFLDFKMSDIFQSFQNRNSDISLSFEVQPTDDLIKRMQARKYDIVIAYITPETKKVLDDAVNIQVIDSHCVHAALHQSHPLAGSGQINVVDLMNQPLLMLEKESAVEHEIQRAINLKKIIPKRIKRYPSFRSMLGGVAMNQGICFHSSGVGTEIVKPPVVSVPFSPDITMLTAVMYLKNHKNSEAIKRLCQFFESNSQ